MQTLPTKTSNSLSLPTHLNKPVLVDKRELSLCMQTTGLQGRSGGLGRSGVLPSDHLARLLKASFFVRK